MHGVYNETLKVGHFSHCSIGKSSHNPRGRGIRLCPLTEGASLEAQLVKNLHTMQKTQETWVQSLGWEDPSEKEMATISLQPIAPIFLTGKFHGQSCLVGYSSQGHKESDRIEHTCKHTL